jgi:hypothetical protein
MEEIGFFMYDDDRKRPPTQGWTFSPTGGMTRNSGEVVVIEEAAPLPAPVDRTEEPTAPKQPPPPMPAGRKSAIEVFNEELAALERPLEGEVEYFDDAQPASPWRQAGAFFAVVVVVGVGGALLISRNRAAADARELTAGQASPAAAVAAAPPAPALAQTPPAPAAPEAPAAAAGAPAAHEGAADSAAGEDSARPAPSTRSAWTKVRTKAGHAKHARFGSSKTTTHRTSKTKRTVIAKNTVSRRH